MAQLRPYFHDVADEEFMAMLPTAIRMGTFVEPDPPCTGFTSELLETDLRLQFPANAFRLKLERLTDAINAKVNDVPPYDLAKFHIIRVFVSHTRHCVVADAEAWFHRSGCMMGKVLRVQIVLTERPPFLRLSAAAIVRTESEAQMLLLDGAPK